VRVVPGARAVRAPSCHSIAPSTSRQGRMQEKGNALHRLTLRTWARRRGPARRASGAGSRAVARATAGWRAPAVVGLGAHHGASHHADRDPHQHGAPGGGCAPGDRGGSAGPSRERAGATGPHRCPVPKRSTRADRRRHWTRWRRHGRLHRRPSAGPHVHERTVLRRTGWDQCAPVRIARGRGGSGSRRAHSVTRTRGELLASWCRR